MGAGPDRILFFLTGATAVGKTEWALRWARENDAEIVSCDAQLFYRGMDLGTAKPTREERAAVPHYLIDILPIDQAMNVARYAGLARAAIEDIAARGRKVLITGGSGFYLKSFFAPTADDVAVPPAVREEVARIEAQEGVIGLRDALGKLNPAGLGTLDLDNPRRLARALERCLASGRGLAELQADFARQPAPFADWTLRLVQLDRPMPELEQRIAVRTRAMLAAGLVDEVKVLLDQGLARNPSAARAIGYREVIAALAGETPMETLEQEIRADTRALVKKQRTWFRTQVVAHRVVPAGEGYRADLFA